MHTIVTLFLLWIAHFLVDFMIGIWSVYKTISYLDLGIAGIIAAGCAFVGEGAQLFFGNLSDRGYRKRLIAMGVLFTSANVLLALSSNYVLLAFLYLMTCIGSGAFHPCAVALIGSLTNRQKGLFITLFASGGALGMAFSQVVFSTLYLQKENYTLFLLLPSLVLVLILIAIGYGKKENLISEGVHKTPFGLKMFRDYFRDRGLKYLYITQVCNQIMFWGIIFILPDVLVSRGYSQSIAFGGGHMAFIMGSVFTMVPSGYLADRFSPQKVIFFCSLIGMLSFFAFLFMPLLSPFYVLMLLLFSGSFLGIVQPLAVALGNDLGRKNPGMVSAFTMGMVWCVSETVGPAGAGLLSKLFVEDAPAKALMILGTLFPLMLYSIAQIPEPSTETELA